MPGKVSSAMDPKENAKRAAAEAAALEVREGMTVGLGTGSTVAHLLPVLARRALDIRCVATSPATEASARAVGLRVDPFDLLEHVDIAVDGADQVAPDLWLVKGGGAAHTREKVVAAAASRFLVIVSDEKLVPALAPPVPVEVLVFGLTSTLRRLGELGPVARREGVLTPDGNAIVDFGGPVGDPEDLSRSLRSVPGVVEHGLFPPTLVSEVLAGRADGTVDRLSGPTEAAAL